MRLLLEGVAVEIGGSPIVSDVDLAVADGEVVGLVGPNGSGRSTLLRSVYRALRPSAGLISLDGNPLAGLSARETPAASRSCRRRAPPTSIFTSPRS